LKTPEVLKQLNIDENALFEFIITHIIYDLNIDDMIILLDYIYRENYNSIENSQFISIVKTVINKHIFVKDGKKGILLIQNKVQQFKNIKKSDDLNIMQQLNDIGIVLVMFKNEKWDITEKLSDYNLMKPFIVSSTLTKKDIINKKVNETIGFIMQFKNENYLVFKTKKLSDNRSKGSRCDQKLSDESIVILDSILSEVKGAHEFFIEERKDKNKQSIFENKKYLCILQEFILYIFNENNVNGKIWYLNPIKSTLSNIENLSS
jgi:hypothetical protein